MKITEMRELSAEGLEQIISEKQNELKNLRLKHKSTDGGIESPGRLAAMRREIARMLTVQNEKKAVKQ